MIAKTLQEPQARRKEKSKSGNREGDGNLFQYIRNGLRYKMWGSTRPLEKSKILARSDCRPLVVSDQDIICYLRQPVYSI